MLVTDGMAMACCRLQQYSYSSCRNPFIELVMEGSGVEKLCTLVEEYIETSY